MQYITIQMRIQCDELGSAEGISNCFPQWSRTDSPVSDPPGPVDAGSGTRFSSQYFQNLSMTASVSLGYVLVTRDSGGESSLTPSCNKYTEGMVTQCFQFMGCKPQRSQKVSRKLFWLLGERKRSMELGKDGIMGGPLALQQSEFEALVLSSLGNIRGI